MDLYTGRGDKGETSLLNGTRVAKDDPRITACGEVDELNALLGWVRAVAGPGPIGERLMALQRDLHRLGAELAAAPDAASSLACARIGSEDCCRLERWIDEASAVVEPLRNFVLPGGVEPACRLHVARVCGRRAERAIVTLARTVTLPPEVLVYMNRLSDLLFAWARQANHQANTPDVIWTPTS